MKGAMREDFADQYPWFQDFLDASPYTTAFPLQALKSINRMAEIVGEKVEQMFYIICRRSRVARIFRLRWRSLWRRKINSVQASQAYQSS